MADEASREPNPFDIHTVRQLVQLMSRHDLSEIDLRQGGARLRLRRGARVKAVAAAALPAPAAAPPPPPEQPANPAAATPEAPAKKLHQIKSTVIGTFYDREKPDAQPYVAVGARVTPSSVVGLVEAMKIFNEMLAECSGVVVRKLVDNAQPVVFDTVLFEVDPEG